MILHYVYIRKKGLKNKDENIFEKYNSERDKFFPSIINYIYDFVNTITFVIIFVVSVKRQNCKIDDNSTNFSEQIKGMKVPVTIFKFNQAILKRCSSIKTLQ